MVIYASVLPVGERTLWSVTVKCGKVTDLRQTPPDCERIGCHGSSYSIYTMIMIITTEHSRWATQSSCLHLYESFGSPALSHSLALCQAASRWPLAARRKLRVPVVAGSGRNVQNILTTRIMNKNKWCSRRQNWFALGNSSITLLED